MPLLFNERVDTLSMTEDLGVVRKMKTKARITGLTTLSSLALQEAYNQVGLPQPGTYYTVPQNSQTSIFGMLVLVRREFDLIDESTIDVIMSWEHFLDGDNQEMAIAGTSPTGTGRNHLYGKTRTSVQQTKVNYFPTADPGIRVWPKPGSLLVDTTTSNIAPAVRTYIAGGLGGFDRITARAYFDALYANQIVGGTITQADINALADQAVMYGNNIDYNGFYWHAQRPIYIRTDGAVIPSLVPTYFIRGDPVPSLPPLQLTPFTLSDAAIDGLQPFNGFYWPTITDAVIPYTDPTTGRLYSGDEIILAPPNRGGGGSVPSFGTAIFPGDINAQSALSPFNGTFLRGSGRRATWWPWRIALDVTPTPPPGTLPGLGPRADIIYPTQNWQGQAPDMIRRVIAVGHQFPLNDKQFKGQTFYQTGEVSIMQPHKTYTVQGFAYAQDVRPIEDGIIGKVNKFAWQGGDAHMWMCTSVSSEALFTNFRYKLNFEFQKNLDTWDPTAVFNDQRTGRPPANLIPNFGIRADIPFAGELDFDAYFLAQFEF